eukprot:scaffold21731_cov134-Isochrysis_galbana.AAC.2
MSPCHVALHTSSFGAGLILGPVSQRPPLLSARVALAHAILWGRLHGPDAPTMRELVAQQTTMHFGGLACNICFRPLSQLLVVGGWRAIYETSEGCVRRSTPRAFVNST